MLSQELRPKTLDDMAGQEEAKKLLKAIIKNPENAPKVLLFCGSFGTGKCVVGDTRVHTSDGYKRIDSLIDAPKYDEEGFMDISSNHLRVVGSEATHYYYGGKKKVIEISSGRFKITGTYNHRVRVYGGKDGLQWKKLSEITTDDYVAIPLNHDILFNNKSKTYDFMKDDISERNKGYLLGTFFCNLLESGYKGDDSFDSFIFVHHSDDGFMGNLKDEYYNMGEIIKDHMYVVDIAKQAMENLGIKPLIKAIRGGTDGSKISFMGLPTPNIFAGGENFHGKYEFVALESMEKATDVIVEIVKLNAER